MSKANTAASRSGRAAMVGRDLVALGPMAPVRAMYEVAKRSGVHGALLRRFVAGASIRPLSPVPGFGMPQVVPSAASARSLCDAQLILDQGHRAFGKRFPVERPEHWITLPGTGLSWPREKFWWDIDIRTDRRLGDVKWTWELGRHRDLVVLARAAVLEPEGPWLGALEERLRGWFEISQPEVGIHWYSNLEIALRVIAWMQIFSLVHERLDQALVATMADHVGRAERHLMFDFPYTASSMRNNHLLGDALGLIAIDRFTGGDGSRRPARLAERFFRAQLARHMRADGSMIEDSLSYHRFVMEMLVTKRILGDEGEALTEALSGSAAHLVRQGALEGDLPQWGDWDEGRVLASSGDPMDIRGSVLLGLALTGGALPADVEFDEVVWYAGDVDRRATFYPAAGGVSGGIAHVSCGPWRAWFKVGLHNSHQHADLGHVSVQYMGKWVVVDPGTGTYNGPLEIRNALRTSRSHNGIRVQGEDILIPHRAFRWLNSPRASWAPPLNVSETVVLFAAHDAFMDTARSRVARAVLISPTAVTCVDWIERPLAGELTVALPSDSVDEVFDGSCIKLRGMGDATQVAGQENPFAGWVSPTYGKWTPAAWLDVERPGGVASWWGLAEAESPEPVVNGRRIDLAGLGLSINFGLHGVVLTVSCEMMDHTLRACVEAP